MCNVCAMFACEVAFVIYQSCTAWLAASRRGHRAHGADGGGTRAAFQYSWCGRCLPHSGLCLRWGSGGKAYTGHLVHWCKEAILGLTLEIPDDTQIQPCKTPNVLSRQSTIANVRTGQYLVPATAPSFFPKGSSSSTPHHSPLAKSVSPKKRTTPAFDPAT